MFDNEVSFLDKKTVIKDGTIVTTIREQDHNVEIFIYFFKKIVS
jgi:hypothetical protein